MMMPRSMTLNESMGSLTSPGPRPRKGEAGMPSDIFFKTIKGRGFFNKLSQEELMARAKIFEYKTLQVKIEKMMTAFVKQNCQLTFATFIINTLLYTQHELNLVEDELLSFWATVGRYRVSDAVVAVYYDFLNDALKGPTHLHFYI